jgi:hypothetical protein
MDRIMKVRVTGLGGKLYTFLKSLLSDFEGEKSTSNADRFTPVPIWKRAGWAT